jgi:hypothetical protein
MARKIWTAAELEQMSAAEQDAVFRASIIRNLDDVPPEFLDRVRTNTEHRIAEIEHRRKR